MLKFLFPFFTDFVRKKLVKITRRKTWTFCVIMALFLLRRQIRPIENYWGILKIKSMKEIPVLKPEMI